jgi:hypothetical protein
MLQNVAHYHESEATWILPQVRDSVVYQTHVKALPEAALHHGFVYIHSGNVGEAHLEKRKHRETHATTNVQNRNGSRGRKKGPQLAHQPLGDPRRLLISILVKYA